jgi:hypothetical protein
MGLPAFHVKLNVLSFEQCVLFRRGPMPISVWSLDMDSGLNIYHNTSCRYKDMQKDAGMTILDIGLLTGYTPDVDNLNQVSTVLYLLNNDKTCE